MKIEPKLTIIPNENGDGKIVILEKDISNLDETKTFKEIKKFYTTDIKLFEDYIDCLIRHELSKKGINIQDTRKSALNDLFNGLKLKIEITDRYENVFNGIIFRKNKETIVLDDGVLSVANEIRFL